MGLLEHLLIPDEDLEFTVESQVYNKTSSIRNDVSASNTNEIVGRFGG